MIVEIVGFSQEMDFQDGSVTNFISFRLPDGSMVKAIVSDDGARQLIVARAAAGPMPNAPAPSPPQSHSSEEPTFEPTNMGSAKQVEDGVFVFGGDAEIKNRVHQNHQAELRRRMPQEPSMSRTVPKDNYGYPIVPSNGGTDLNDIVGGSVGSGPVDEDGVGQA